MSLNQKLVVLGEKRSVIRELFEFASLRASVVGEQNVFDFSIGNPSVNPPKSVAEEIQKLTSLENQAFVHGYTSAQGDVQTRSAIAKGFSQRASVALSENNIYMTCGAAASLCIALSAVLGGEQNEVVVISPYFTEYRVFISSCGGKIVEARSLLNTFMPDLDSLKACITKNTAALLINSPNNPTGVTYGSAEMEAIAKILKEKENEFGNDIYLISDEPYRELYYEKDKLPCVFDYFDNSMICYSYSKALTLAGERVGYVATNPNARAERKLMAALLGAGRSLGYICAPSMFQKVIAKIEGQTSDIEKYRENRDLMYGGLTKIGFTCVKPTGAFYLFVKALEKDANAFCERAKKYDLLLVPSDDFGVTGYVRIAYCVPKDKIERAMPLFEALYAEYQKQ